MKIFQCTNFFQLTCLHDFFFGLSMNSFFWCHCWQVFFSDKFPLHVFFFIFFLWGGAGGGIAT